MALPSHPELVGLKQKNTTNFKNLWIPVCFLLKNKRFQFNRVLECGRENLGTEARNSDHPSGPPSRCVNLAMSLGPFACKGVSRRRGSGGWGGGGHWHTRVLNCFLSSHRGWRGVRVSTLPTLPPFKSSSFVHLIFFFFCNQFYTGICKILFEQRADGLKTGMATSLVAQWLRIHLPVQGTQVWSLVGGRRSHLLQDS